MAGEKVHKKRSQTAYNKKVHRVEVWYNHLLEERKKNVTNPNTKLEPKRKPLKKLEDYINQIKKPLGA